MIRSGLVKSACMALALAGVSPPPANADFVHRGATAVGPRGGVYHRGGTSLALAMAGAGSIAAESMGITAASTAAAMAPGRVPGWYHWAPGGAIAAGAALGVLATGAAIAYAGQPPAPGMCWYYTDPSYRQGFWDGC